MLCSHPFESMQFGHFLRKPTADSFHVETSLVCGVCGEAMNSIDGTLKFSQVFFTPLGDGPGTILKRRLEKAGYAQCDRCYMTALRMNRGGPDWCQENLTRLVDDIEPRATEAFKQKHEWVGKFLGVTKLEGPAIRAGVQSMIMRCVEEWRQVEAAQL